MTKLTLNVPPTFRATAHIPTPGGKPLSIPFEFKHFRKSDFVEFLTGPEAKTRTDLEAVKAVAVNWFDMEREMTDEALAELFEERHAAPRAILNTWAAELTGQPRPAAA